ncbi:MAG: acetate--CoA ligase family protein [Candidatus Hadarchaeales archaeon]
MGMEYMLSPKSVAVIGASREPDKVGYRVLKNIVEGGFGGGVYPVNPNAEEILGLKCFKNVVDVPDDIDLAIISVPAKIVPSVARECGNKGVKGLVVISAGFGETGAEGLRLERELANTCKEYGMRLQGPNCLGTINTRLRLNATFSKTTPISGKVALLSQSGALGSAMLNWALDKGVGFTNFVSLGNEVDLTAADFLEMLENDDSTKAIGMYIEGVKDGRRFIKICRKVSRKKPIIVLKSGTTETGIKAVSSHTGSLAGSDVAFTAACKKAGLIRVLSLEDLFDLIRGFGSFHLVNSSGVLIVTNGGGPGVLAADTCEMESLTVPLLDQEIYMKLREMLPPHATVHNPVDVLGDADDGRYKNALEVSLSSTKIGGAIVIVTPQAMTPLRDIARALAEVRKIYPDKIILPVFMGVSGEPIDILKNNGLPNYEFPESAVKVMSRMHQYTQYRAEREEPPATFDDFDYSRIKSIISRVKESGRTAMTVDECIDVAKACNINVPEIAIARNAEEAVEIAERIGYPVVMKVISPDILHKTDIGGVKLNVNGANDVRKNYELMMRKIKTVLPESRISGVMIYRMAPQGKEIIIGAVRDAQFGPILMFGLGGIYVNFLKDVAYAMCPISLNEASELVKETKAYTLLRGVRGEPPSDTASVIDTILRISHLISTFDDILEIEINPTFVYGEGKGCLAIDIRAVVSQ